MCMIEMKDVCFAYDRRPVLQQICFSIPAGALVAVLGPNGAGKSTLFRCLLGFLKPSSGRITLCGQTVRPCRSLAKLAAYIPQSAEPVFNYTVLDTVLMGTTGSLPVLASPGTRQKQAAQAALQQLGIAELAQRGICQISGGERQLALIARALVQQAKILIMDEPTANLDYGNQQRVLQQIRGLTRQGYTVLMSTHNPEHAIGYASHILALKDGKICAWGETEQTLQPSLIAQLYGIDVTIAEVQTPSGTARSLVASQRKETE